jgi:hypothetical protein
MTTWIHFIGQQYYSEKSFKAEALKYGVTRRISPLAAKQMTYGDRVLLAINDGKSAVLFGSFIVETLSGLGEEATQALKDRCTLTQVAAGGRIVRRGCGSYVEGPTWHMNSPISFDEIIETATEAGGENKFMLGGEFEDISRVRLQSMRFSQGFRPFNFGRFLMDYARAAVAKLPKVKGQFYVTDIEVTDEEKATAAKVSTKLIEKRLFQQVSGYAKK